MTAKSARLCVCMRTHGLNVIEMSVFQSSWTSLVLQWLRIHLPMLRICTPSLVQEGSTCGGAAKLVCHNY